MPIELASSDAPKIPIMQQLGLLRTRYLTGFPQPTKLEAKSDVLKLLGMLDKAVNEIVRLNKRHDRMQEEYSSALMTITAVARRAPGQTLDVPFDDVEPVEGARIEFNDLTLDDGRLVKRFQYFDPPTETGAPTAPGDPDAGQA